MQKLNFFRIDLPSIDLLKKIPGQFEVYGTDYEALKKVSTEENLVGISYNGPLRLIDSMPDCHLEICLGNESIMDLTETIHSLDPKGIGFKIEASAKPEKVIELMKFLSAFEYPVDVIETIGRHPKEYLFKYLNFYLYESKNKSIIEPFHSILNAFIKNEDFDIWRWNCVDLNSFYKVLDYKIVYLDREGNNSPIGSLESGAVQKWDEYTAIEKGRMQAYTDNEKCKSCNYFFACSGYSEVILGQCDEWFKIFDQLHDVSLELKQVLNSEKI